MWGFQRLKHGMSNPPFGYDFLQLTADGRPTIRDRFLANVLTAGAAPWVVPLTMPATSGPRLLQELTGRWKMLKHHPDVIYLDSAHEVEETLIEVKLAYSVLRPYGILFGDDWAWDGVRHDVVNFARELSTPPPRRSLELRKSFLQASVNVGLNCTTPELNRPYQASTLTLCEPGGTWVLFKGLV